MRPSFSIIGSVRQLKLVCYSNSAVAHNSADSCLITKERQSAKICVNPWPRFCDENRLWLGFPRIQTWHSPQDWRRDPASSKGTRRPLRRGCVVARYHRRSARRGCGTRHRLPVSSFRSSMEGRGVCRIPAGGVEAGEGRGIRNRQSGLHSDFVGTQNRSARRRNSRICL